MYEIVPTNVLHIFRVASKSLLTPKSHSFTSPNEELTRMLSGLTSLCTYFLTSCRYASPIKVYNQDILRNVIKKIKEHVKTRKLTLAMIRDTIYSGKRGIWLGQAYLNILIMVLMLPQSMYSKARLTLPSS